MNKCFWMLLGAARMKQMMINNFKGINNFVKVEIGRLI